MSLLEVKNINAFYDNSQVLFNMSLDISKNKIILLKKCSKITINFIQLF